MDIIRRWYNCDRQRIYASGIARRMIRHATAPGTDGLQEDLLCVCVGLARVEMTRQEFEESAKWFGYPLEPTSSPLYGLDV